MEYQNIHSSIKEMLDELEKNKLIDVEKTVQLGLKAYSLCEETNYETGMVYALFCIGKAYFDMNEYDRAMSYLFDCITLAQTHNICDLQVLSYLNIGNIYFDIGDYEESYKFYSTAEKVVKLYNHSKNYYSNYSYEYFDVKICNNIGEIYRILGLYSDAVSYYKRAQEFDSLLDYHGTAGVILTNLGIVECHFGNYETALSYINESIVYLEKYNYKIGLCEAYGELALIYQKKHMNVESEKYYNKAISLSTEIRYAFVKINLLIEYAKFLEDIKNIEESINQLEDAYTISLENKLYKAANNVCKKIITLFEKQDDSINLNKYYKLYFQNERILEPLELDNKTRNFKMKVELENEKKNILKKSEKYRRRSEKLIEVIKNISIISEVGEKLTTSLELHKIYEMLNHEIQNFLKASVFGIALYDESSKTIEYQYCMEKTKSIKMRNISIDSKSSMAAKSLREKKNIIINDLPNEYLSYIEDTNYIYNNNSSYEQLNSVMFCPLIIEENILGVITIQAHDKNFFTMLNIEVIKALTSYVAIAINNTKKSIKLLDEVEKRRKLQEELESSNNKLIYLSENDELTQLSNRRKFNYIMEEEWSRAKQNKSQLSMLIFDVDFFKQYNDNYGHVCGDNCLFHISSAIKKSLFENSFAARYGGDEFVVVLPNMNVGEAIEFGDMLRRKVEALAIPNQFSENSEVVTITVGVSSVIPDDTMTIKELIKQADLALYEAKRSGKNKTVGYKKV